MTSLSLLADTYLEAVAATGSRRSRYPNSTSEGEDIRPRSFDYYRYLRHLVFHSLELKEAEELELKIVEARKRILGLEYPDTLTSMTDLAVTWREQGRVKEALEYKLQVVEARRKVFGPDHRDILLSMNNLAHSYMASGSKLEAVDLMNDVTVRENRALRAKHLFTRTAKGMMALWKKDEQDDSKAE